MNIPIAVPNTDWTVTEILPISLSGGVKTGSVRVSCCGSREGPRLFRWKADHIANSHWHVMGEGALTQSGARVPNISEYPFMMDSPFNRGLSEILSRFLDEQF